MIQFKNFVSRGEYKQLIVFFSESEYTLTEFAEQSILLKYLINSSNFYPNDQKELLEVQKRSNAFRLLSKLSAIGYLLTKDLKIGKAIIGININGGNGSSIIGKILQVVTPTTILSGDLDFTDLSIWSDIDDSTKLVYINNIPKDFSFEVLFPNITGDWKLKEKSIPFEKSPNIYISTNNNIIGTGVSWAERQWCLGFYNHYNNDNIPFSLKDWNEEQWNITHCLLINCMYLYYQFGEVKENSSIYQKRANKEIVNHKFNIYEGNIYKRFIRTF